MTRKLLLSIALIASVLFENPAVACLAPNFERWVFVEQRPVEIPSGLTLVRVDVPASIETWGMIELTVLEGDVPLRVGSRLLISPGIDSSCSRWGAVGRRAYALGVITFDEDGRGFFAAIQQRNPDYEQDRRGRP